MATCKDCFHFEVCDSGRHIGEYIKDDGVYSEGVEKECETFRNSADVAEIIHAKWEIISDGYYPCCSHCKNEPENGVMSKYCPECGAKMATAKRRKAVARNNIPDKI